MDDQSRTKLKELIMDHGVCPILAAMANIINEVAHNDDMTMRAIATRIQAIADE